jgi:uncharacterized protein YeaO (DUF488 family)
MLAKDVGDFTLHFCYVDGQPAMVSAMRQTLGEAGVDDDNIRTEEFSGYSEAEQGWDMNIKTKRVYEQPDKEDGRRILVDRIWPRGISKDRARLSDWRRDLAPSNELRRWFGHEPHRWEEFKERYRAELEVAGKTGDLRDIAPGRRTSRSSSAPRTRSTTTPGLWKPSSGRSSICLGRGKVPR